MLCPSSSPCARLSALLVVASALGLAAPARAAGGNKEAQAKKALKQALDDDYLNTRFDDAEQRLRAALQGCAKACSKALRARLHVALGSVLAGGKKELEDARDEFVEALGLDPRIEPSPDLLSTEVSFAYEQARKKLHLAAGKGPPPDAKPAKKPPKADVEEDPEDKPERDPEGKPEKKEPRDKDEPEEKPREPAAPPEPARKNWITVSFAPDFAFVSGTDVCTQASQSGAHYVCLRSDGSRYGGTPTLGNGDNVNAGLTIATLRVMLGYDRLVHPNVTLGVRFGFAFNGASGDGVSFLPLHAEGRIGFWPGHDPFVGRGVRPMIIVSGGVAQVDAKVNVQVLEDPSASGTGEPPSQTLAAYRQSGLGFAAATFGVQFAPSVRVALHLAARASVTFPSVTAVISPETGVSMGF